ncbi:MAG: hypothetical protein RML33_11200 [Acidobacteriota bacterium]|nr:hypothetical protein [Leptospiraceae bacterium]MDW8305387.1 hypothetical protein [Acidobacteriota bacterium]
MKFRDEIIKIGQRLIDELTDEIIRVTREHAEEIGRQIDEELERLRDKKAYSRKFYSSGNGPDNSVSRNRSGESHL